MRKKSVALVSYSSSEENESESEEQPAKKRKLPSLSSSLLTPVPIDRPELHQGRIRTNPHIEGQWAAHVYLPLLVHQHSALYCLVEDVLKHAKNTVPTLNEISYSAELPKTRELHVSLSRPVYLRAHQREDLKRAVRSLSKRFSLFTASFATFSELVNDEHTRTFLAMEVGAGHHELQDIVNALAPTLHAIRQKDYYSDPRFHASIGWALLHASSTVRNSTIADDISLLPESIPTRLETNDSPRSSTEKFTTISHLPKNLITELNELYGARLSSAKTGSFDVDRITVKIGKDIYSWRFSGT